jgi:hypothetical protein
MNNNRPYKEYSEELASALEKGLEAIEKADWKEAAYWDAYSKGLQEGARALRYSAEAQKENRWEVGFRNIVSILIGSRVDFEIKDIVEQVRAMKSYNDSDTQD